MGGFGNDLWRCKCLYLLPLRFFILGEFKGHSSRNQLGWKVRAGKLQSPPKLIDSPTEFRRRSSLCFKHVEMWIPLGFKEASRFNWLALLVGEKPSYLPQCEWPQHQLLFTPQPWQKGDTLTEVETGIKYWNLWLLG